MKLYPHNNNSLLVVQHGSRPNSKDKEVDPPDFMGATAGNRDLDKPIFAAQVDPPTPVLTNTKPEHQVDSPLTNPRAAPEPPIIQFIPPTPNKELENEVSGDGAVPAEDDPPQRRLSLAQRARRYSETLFPRLGSLRKPREASSAEEDRDRYLSPLWRPQGFWDEFDSDEDEDDFEPMGSLPKGGDTSDVGEGGDTRKTLFPRAMSKRLPGFRGTGGFMVGNSLGLDRHGTNNRRHYVSTTTRTLSKRQSEELLRNLSSKVGSASQESVRRIAQARTFVVPFTGGKRAQWVGTQQFRAKVHAMQLAKEEKEREKRRQRLRNSIGYRVYHDG